MKTLDALAEIENLVNSEATLREIVESLRLWKSIGLTQSEAMQALTTLRGQAPNEGAEDRILEIMDFAGGFCSPHMKIWD